MPSERLQFPALLVTHDAAEALVAAQTIAIIKEGRILQHGPSEEVYMKPVSVDVAKGACAANVINASDLPVSLTADLQAKDAKLVIRPEGVQIDPAAQTSATVVSRHLMGPLVRLSLRVGTIHLAAFAPRTHAPAAKRPCPNTSRPRNGVHLPVRLDLTITLDMPLPPRQPATLGLEH